MIRFLICTSRPGKSISNHSFALAEGLKRLGHEVTLLIDLKHKMPEGYKDIPVFTWPSNRPTKLKDALFFFKLCKRVNPDVVIGQFSSTNISIVVSWILGVKNRIISQHTLISQLADDLDLSQFWLRRRFKQLIFKYFSTHIIANSRDTAADVIEEYNLNTSKISVIHYLIRDKRISNHVLPIEQRENRIAFVSRLEKSKGHEGVIREIPDLIKVLPNFKLVCFGKGSEKDKLTSLLKELGIEEHVELVGFISPESVYTEMERSLFHISASKSEAFGLVNIEALSVGTPILARKTGGIKDIVEDGINGYFFDPEIPGDLTEKIKSIHEDWGEFSCRARNSFTNKYSSSNPILLENQAKQLVNILD